MNLKWFFEAQGQMSFWYGQATAMVTAGLFSLRDPQWSRDLVDWVSNEAIPSLIDFVSAAGEVLLELVVNHGSPQ